MNMRNFLIALSFVAVVAAGGVFAPSASALTADEIKAQIKELLAKVAELTKQLKALRDQDAATTDATSTDVDQVTSALQHRICRILYRNLAHGVSGNDVKSLQEFLHDEGYFSADATGYFGALTREALMRWQASQGVVMSGSAQTTGWGVLGPLTRERIRAWCGSGAGALKASPTSGPAPLTVNFWYVLGDKPSSNYSIDFGDGTTGTLGEIGCGGTPSAAIAACPRALVTNHTYTANGIYKAVLSRTIDPCGGNPMCLAPVYQEIVGAVQIYVGERVCTTEYKPVCGAKQIVCITTPCNPVPTTYGNRCEMNADGASFLYEGVCRPDPIPCTPRPACLDTTPRCLLPEPVEGWCPSANKPPVISGLSGPTTLRVNEQGTWTIEASDPENDSLSYRITWGDEQTILPYAASIARDAFVQTTIFTHAYSAVGTYTVVITVRDSVGQEAKTSTTVRVGSESIACTMDAKQCPDGSYVGRTGPNCEFKCPTANSGALCTYNGQTYAEGQTQIITRPCTGNLIGIPGECSTTLNVCKNGQWVSTTQTTSYTTTVDTTGNCPAGYGWCPAGPAGYSCVLLDSAGKCTIVR